MSLEHRPELIYMYSLQPYFEQISGSCEMVRFRGLLPRDKMDQML